MLYLSAVMDEQCARDKENIHIICPHVWIHYVISGKGYFNGKEIHGGEGFITYPGDECSYRPDTADPWRYVWMRLHGDDSEKILRKCGFPDVMGTFEHKNSELLSTTVASINLELLISGKNRMYAEAAAKLIFSTNGTFSTDESLSSGEIWVNRSKEYINTNLHKKLRIEQLAATLHIDRKYLRNLFVKHIGISPEQYVIRTRLTRAKEFLISTESSISVIAASLGYNDALGFSKIFKKHTGLSPTEYRNRYRQ